MLRSIIVSLRVFFFFGIVDNYNIHLLTSTCDQLVVWHWPAVCFITTPSMKDKKKTCLLENIVQLMINNGLLKMYF